MDDSRLADRVTLLRGGWLFSECTDDELERVAALAHPVHVPQGQVVVREGEPGDEFYVVVDGTTRVTLEDAPIADIGPGSFFGEMALLDGGERVATVTAITDVELLDAPPRRVQRDAAARDADDRAQVARRRRSPHPRARSASGPRDAVRGVIRRITDRATAVAPADPDHVALRRAARVVVVGVPLFVLFEGALDMRGSRDPGRVRGAQPRRHARTSPDRSPAERSEYAYAGLASLAMLPIGAALVGNDIALVVVTGVIVFLTMFLGTLGGPFFAARYPVVLSLLFATTAGQWGSTLPERMLGWGAGPWRSRIAAVVLWPLRPRTPATSVVADVCRAMTARRSRRPDCSRIVPCSAPRPRASHLQVGAVAHDERIAAELVHVSERMVSDWVMRGPVEPAPEDAARSSR